MLNLFYKLIYVKKQLFFNINNNYKLVIIVVKDINLIL